MANILLVDDDEAYLKSLVDALQTVSSHTIISVTNSKAAFGFINKGNIDLLITDYLLKGDKLNGDKIIRSIRDVEKRDDYENYMPCILITGSEGERQMIARLMDLKASFFSKDEDVTVLIAKIEDGLREKEARKNFGKIEQSSHLYSHPLMKYVVFPLVVGILLFVLGKIWIDNSTQTPTNTNNSHIYVGVNVFDSNNMPLQDTRVVIEGMAESALTDSNGFASLALTGDFLPKNEVVVTVFKEGYVSKKTSTSLANKKSALVFRLEKVKRAK